MKLLKIILLTVCILSTAVAFGQAAAGTNAISSQPVVYRGPTHPQQASSKPMAQQQTLLGQGGYTSATGERPLWEFAPAPHYTPLGDLARSAKKDREPGQHSSTVWEDCLEKSGKACRASRN
jgi:hypothetical protein